MSGDPKGGSKPLPPPIAGLAIDDERRNSAAVEYQRQLASLDLEALDEFDDPLASPAPEREPDPADEPEHQPELEPEPEPQARLARPPSRERSEGSTPNLEPVDEGTHPPANRRMPTQPPSALALELDRPSPDQPEPRPRAQPPASSNPPSPAGGSGSLRPGPSSPEPRRIGQHSPAPVRRGLFSFDRPTNFLAGAAVGLLLAVFPAKKLAESYETREVAPRLLDLDKSVEQTLAVDAGLVERPEVVAASIHDGRGRTRRRFVLVWLLGGLAIGAGLGFAPRPGD